MTQKELADKLMALSKQMIDLGCAMDYYGGLDTEMRTHGAELVNAGHMVGAWAREIMEDGK